jgi:leukotriene-A4 hydrolase
LILLKKCIIDLYFRIYGKVTLSFISHQNNVEFIILDTKSLDIKNVYNNIGNQPLKFELLNEKPEDYPLGIPMKIYPPYPLAVDEKFTAIIEFSTINSAATQWLSKEQTLSKDYPFVYTQCEAIHCRTLFPCQV